MSTDRVTALRLMLEKNPQNTLARFGLANELVKAGNHSEAVEHYTQYLAAYDDEGNGWGRLAESLLALGKPDEARAALTRGIEASRRFGHHGMAAELEARMEEIE